MRLAQVPNAPRYRFRAGLPWSGIIAGLRSSDEQPLSHSAMIPIEHTVCSPLLWVGSGLIDLRLRDCEEMGKLAGLKLVIVDAIHSAFVNKAT